MATVMATVMAMDMAMVTAMATEPKRKNADFQEDIRKLKHDI